jgi:hypothetical protein
VISFDTKSVDVGEVERGAVLDLGFVLRNTGDETLRITGVRPSCGCTVTGEYAEEVPPGGTTTIPIALETEDLHGRISKAITITSNALNETRSILQVKAQVNYPLEVLPNPHVFLHTRRGVPTERAVLLRPQREGLRVTGATSSDRRFAVSLEPAQVGQRANHLGPLATRILPKEGDLWLRVKLEGDFPPGTLNTQVTVTTSDPEVPRVVVRVRAQVQEG